MFRCGRHIQKKVKKMIYMTKDILTKWVTKFMTFKVKETTECSNFNMIPV